jgi:hypothetical protein
MVAKAPLEKAWFQGVSNCFSLAVSLLATASMARFHACFTSGLES